MSCVLPGHEATALARRQRARTWLAKAATVAVGLPSGTVLYWQAQPSLQFRYSFAWWNPIDGAHVVQTEAAGATQYTVPLRPGKIQGFAIFVYNPSDLTPVHRRQRRPDQPARRSAPDRRIDDRHNPADGGAARGQLPRRRPHPAALLPVGPRAVAVGSLVPERRRRQPGNQRPATARPGRLDHQDRGRSAARRDRRRGDRGHRSCGHGVLPERPIWALPGPVGPGVRLLR
jgi:hypothetical protein